MLTDTGMNNQKYWKETTTNNWAEWHGLLDWIHYTPTNLLLEKIVQE